jgi:hypothetical protein
MAPSPMARPAASAAHRAAYADLKAELLPDPNNGAGGPERSAAMPGGDPPPPLPPVRKNR